MPETLTVQVKEVRVKEGTNAKGKPWKSRLLIDSSDDFIGSTFDGALDNVKPGQMLEVERKQDGDYWNIVSVKPVSTEQASDPSGMIPRPGTLGTGDYIKGKEAPETRAGIAASVALKQAVNGATFLGHADVPAVLSAADEYFAWLMSKTATAAPEKASQGLPGASEQPAEEGQLKMVEELCATLASHAPASPDPAYTWKHEAQRYCQANFKKPLVSQCSKAQVNQLIGHLEERINAIQAEAGIPF